MYNMCKKCHKLKSVDDFNLCRTMVSNRHDWCKKCRQERNAELKLGGGRKTYEERFWDKVNKNGFQTIHVDTKCWEWTAHIKKSGYGEFKKTVNGKKMQKKAHRISYEITYGEIPDGLLVRHMCHNRKCVNPDHLQLGNHEENMMDIWQKDAERVSYLIATITDMVRDGATDDEIRNKCNKNIITY